MRELSCPMSCCCCGLTAYRNAISPLRKAKFQIFENSRTFAFRNLNIREASRSNNNTRRPSTQPSTMSYMLPHLHSGYAVDQAILAEQNRLVIMRFGHDWDPECMAQDECLSSIANKMKNMAVIYVVSTNLPNLLSLSFFFCPAHLL